MGLGGEEDWWEDFVWVGQVEFGVCWVRFIKDFRYKGVGVILTTIDHFQQSHPFNQKY